MNRGPVPPTAYEKALTSAASNVHVVSVSKTPEKIIKSIGEEGSENSESSQTATTGKPKLLFYRANKALGDDGRLSRRVEQIALFLSAPPEYNNANSYTRPDFRSGILAKYFDVQIIDVGPNSGAPLGQKAAIVIYDSNNEKVATLNANEALSSKLVGTMNAVLKKDGLDVYGTVIKASSVLNKLYQIEIDLQKLLKRNQTRSIKERVAFNTKVKNQGLKVYKELLAGL